MDGLISSLIGYTMNSARDIEILAVSEAVAYKSTASSSTARVMSFPVKFFVMIESILYVEDQRTRTYIFSNKSSYGFASYSNGKLSISGSVSTVGGIVINVMVILFG